MVHRSWSVLWQLIGSVARRLSGQNGELDRSIPESYDKFVNATLSGGSVEIRRIREKAIKAL